MIEDELYEASTEAGITVRVDMRPAALKQDQSPVELLLSAVSSCAAVDIVAILRKRKKTIQTFTIEASGTRNENPPRYFRKIHLTFIIESPDVTSEELEKASALSIEKYCSVAASLKSEITFSVNVLRTPPSD
jgi:putative redox protein